MVRASVFGLAIGWAAVAAADDVDLASAHARHSTTVYLSSAWSPGPTVPVRIGGDGAVRWNRGHAALETRFGLGGVASVTALGSQLQGHVGLGFGIALPAGGRVVFTPMVAYDLFGIWEHAGPSFAVHYVTLEVPVSITFGRLVLEPFVQLGVARFQGVTDPVVVVGPRIGLVL